MLTPPAALHALLFASAEPLEKKYLAKVLGISDDDLARGITALTASLKESGVTVIETEDEVELRTAPEASELLKKLREAELSRDLGKASLETLAVIAYQGGATRGEIDWVRGVNSTASLRTLLMRGLIEGREDEKDKRRLRYSITTEALAHLGLTRVEDLPRVHELRASATAIIKAEEAAEATSTD